MVTQSVVECIETSTVCRIVGVHPSTLDYWVRTRLVRPSIRRQPGRRRTRLWSVDDVVVVRTVHELRRAGCSLQRVRQAKRYLETHWDGLTPRSVLVWDGSDIFHVDRWGQVESAIRRPGQQVLHLVALPVGAWRRETQNRVSYIHTKRIRDGVPAATAAEALEAAG